jgi:hypothetical protein
MSIPADSEKTAVVAAAPPPLIVEMGKYSKKKIKRFMKGEGPLAAAITESLASLTQEGVIPPNAQTVVVLVKEKRKSSLLGF